jgi:hypothetical protein
VDCVLWCLSTRIACILSAYCPLGFMAARGLTSLKNITSLDEEYENKYEGESLTIRKAL